MFLKQNKMRQTYITIFLCFNLIFKSVQAINIGQQEIIQMTSLSQIADEYQSSSQSLDFRGSTTQKVYRIQPLDRFTRLRALNLSNNMISSIEHLSLPTLKLLNLQFNQISRLQGLRGLPRLEQLLISYNTVNHISHELKYNQGLRKMHLAYNDLKYIEDIRPLCSLPSLSVLSLIGNPFLSTLTYIVFIKMLLPSILILDDRDASEPIITANVYPHEQIFILRDALNKLLDEKNNHQQETFPPTLNQSQEDYKEAISPLKNQTRTKNMVNTDQQQFLTLVEQWISNYSNKLQIKKAEINELSESYSQRLKSNSKPDNRNSIQILTKISRYKEQQQKGLLSAQKKAKLQKLSIQLQKNQEEELKGKQQWRSLLQSLKNRQYEYSKIKSKEQKLKQLREAINLSQSVDVNKVLLTWILFGHSDSSKINYRNMKKYLSGGGLVEQLQSLIKIIFGEQADFERVQKLKQFLQQKSLIEIINNLKELGLKQKADRKRYQKQREKLISKFQAEANELCQQWKQLQNEKRMIKNSKDIKTPERSTFCVEERYSIVEAEQRNKIMMLKKQKQHYENKLGILQQKYQALQSQFQRKYKQLEQFERFFEEFKSQREIVKGLKDETQAVNAELQKKRQLLTQIEITISDLTAKETSLLQRASQTERRCFQRAQELKLLDEKFRVLQQKCRKAGEELNLRNLQGISAQDRLQRVIQDIKQLDKKIERQKSTFQLYEDKLKNLSELQKNKRTSLSNLENQVQSERLYFNDLSKKVSEAEQKLSHLMENSYQYQLKIQEGRKNIESLADVNKVVSDMIERQSQLKRSVMQLQMEQEHLQEVKARLMNQIKIKYDDPDDDL